MNYAAKSDGLAELATAENLMGGIYYHLGEWRTALPIQDARLAPSGPPRALPRSTLEEQRPARSNKQLTFMSGPYACGSFLYS